MPSFRHPSGEEYLLIRSITQDNWLTWRDALPRNPMAWTLLSSFHASWVESLAATLGRVLEASWPGSQKLLESPFRVDRWFDPYDPGTPWGDGRCCRFSVQGLDPECFASGGRKTFSPRHLKIAAVPNGWIQAELIAVPPAPKRKGRKRVKA